MSMAERADLVARLSLDDKLSGQSRRAASNFSRSMGKIGSTATKGVRTAAGNIGKLGLIAAAGIGVAVRGGLESLATLESAVTSVDGAIKQMGLTGKVTGTQVATWANEIEASIGAAFDDKDITQAATTLIRFGKVAPANLRPALVVMTDLATKTGSVDSAASLLAKALADPTKAAGRLARAGVTLTKAEQKQIVALVKAGKLGKAQAIVLGAIAKATKGAAAASQGPYARSMAVLKDVIEDAQRALATGFLPVIQEVASFLSTELAKPDTLARIKEFGEGLAGGLRGLITAARELDWNAIGGSLKAAGSGAKAVLDAFIGMPDWVKTAVLTGWGLNKLTGGAVQDIFGETIKLAFGQFFARGASPANPMWVASVGGLGDGVVGVAAAWLAGLLLSAAALVGALAVVQDQVVVPTLQEQAGKNITGTEAIIASGDVGRMQSALAGVQSGVASLSGLEKIMYDLNANGVKTHTEGLEAALVAAIIKATGAATVNASGDPVFSSHAAYEAAAAEDKVSDTVAQQQATDMLGRLNLVRDKVESTRGAIDWSKQAIVSATRTEQGAIVSAIRSSRPLITVNVDRSGSVTTTYSTGATLGRYDGKLANLPV
jgi:hypothetical protein